jgi:hypothetical protein
VLVDLTNNLIPINRISPEVPSSSSATQLQRSMSNVITMEVYAPFFILSPPSDPSPLNSDMFEETVIITRTDMKLANSESHTRRWHPREDRHTHNKNASFFSPQYYFQETISPVKLTSSASCNCYTPVFLISPRAHHHNHRT